MSKIFEKWRRSISQKIQSAIHANRERAHIFVGPSSRIHLLTRIFVGSLTVSRFTRWFSSLRFPTCVSTMAEETERALSTHRRRRGIAKASITRLSTRLKDLEADISQPATIDHAQRMQQKLETQDAEFRAHHHNVVDLTDSEDSLAREQGVLDEHDDLVAEQAVRIKQLITACSSSDTTPHKIVHADSHTLGKPCPTSPRLLVHLVVS